LIDHNDAQPILDELVWHEDEPNADPVCVPLYFLSKLTRESGTIVIQVGEGSDEQFCGYPWMLRDYKFERSYFRYFSSLPKAIKVLIYKSIKPALQGLNQYMMLDYLRRGAYSNELYWGGSSIFPPVELNVLLTKNYHYLREIPSFEASEIHRKILEQKRDSDYLQRILFTELSWRLPELLLMRIDKIGMAHSIEARVPFLDHRIVEFSMTIPDKIKVADKKTTKIILKKAVESILPKEIIYRPKQGFWAPVNEWLRNHWFAFAKDTILSSELMRMEIFNRNYIEKLFADHKSSKSNNGYKLFTLLTLSLWYKRYF
jgi:asparagine synthase (glutamine-hydrolysing)